MRTMINSTVLLWIAFRFFIFVLRTQHWRLKISVQESCELLSDFLSLFFEHNRFKKFGKNNKVVNCFQIFYLCSSNTTDLPREWKPWRLWIAFRFFIFVLRTQQGDEEIFSTTVVNCFQIFYLCSSNTTVNNIALASYPLWIAFRFFIFVLRTQQRQSCSRCSWLLWIAFRFFIFVLRTQRVLVFLCSYLRCELLSDFLSLFFEHNRVCARQR